MNGVSDGGAVNVSALSAWMYGAPDNIPNSGWPTQYKYITFDFDDIAKAEEYNTQDSPDGWAAYDGTGNFLYSAAFYVDMTSLSSNYSLHIDVYAYPGATTGRKIVVNPGSHDGQANPVPEPATMLLFGTGLAGLAAVARRRKN